ncbi:Terreic acid cluster-specific transcription factor [Lachnellula occidentalis]|uniref:Terreic acid cluster-specific transcription factor n=1 Tax=Lachnellula occidentalis TaxID=215460 RepID=A0A8H8UGW1_9HELO|nr:Terreic acid cluster-specific transcription factor [Lachnellula occidentalis]
MSDQSQAYNNNNNNNNRVRQKDGDKKQKRNKYITRACQDCQRRKVKCSGEDVCAHCRARRVQCEYLPKSDHEGKRTRLQGSYNSNEGRESVEPEPDDERYDNGAPTTNANLSIEERIALLQEEVKRVAKRSTSMLPQEGKPPIQRRRLTISSSVQYAIDFPRGLTEETDTFNLNLSRCRNISLSSQLLALHELSSPSEEDPHPNFANGRVFTIELPKPSRLRHLVTVYFGEMGSFFPVLDQDDTQKRVFQALDDLDYSEYETIIDVDAQNHAIVALLCNMLAIGESMDSTSSDKEDSRPGWPTYVRGRKLLQQCSSSNQIDLDLIRYHTLGALYMLNCDLLQSASQAISIAVQMSMFARLNDQGSWGKCTILEKEFRQKLWWTIYYLDRRITQRLGTPYLIRDAEVAVEDFETQGNSTAEEFNQDPMTVPVTIYYQVLINFSRLWGRIWDTFFAATAQKSGNLEEIEITDTRILYLRKTLSQHLAWDSDRVSIYVSKGEKEPQIRQRLTIFIRINLLRMIIRQNPLLSHSCNEEGKSFCALLAKDTIEAISAFANVCPQIRASGYFLSTALVECIYHLVFIIKSNHTQIQYVDAIESFRCAYQLLTDYSGIWTTANRALQALGTAVFDGNSLDEFLHTLSSKSADSSMHVDKGPSSGDNRPRSSKQVEYHQQDPVQHMAPPRAQDIMGLVFDQNSHQEMNQRAPQRGQHGDNSEFIQDLANSYGDLDFDIPRQYFGNL